MGDTAERRPADRDGVLIDAYDGTTAMLTEPDDDLLLDASGLLDAGEQ